MNSVNSSFVSKLPTLCGNLLQGISAAVALNNERTVFRACQCSYLILLTCDYECHTDTQICLLTTLLYLDMWAMVMLAPAPSSPPCRVTSCSPPHRLNVCTTFTVRQGLSGQTSWCWRSHRLWFRFYPPSCTISIYVCVCVLCAVCVLCQ